MKHPNFKITTFENSSRLGIIVLVLVFLLSGCSSIPSVKPYLTKDRDSGWINDISYLEKTLPKVHKNLFFHLPEQEFQKQLEELKKKVPQYSNEQMEIALSVILASIGDTHTGSNIGSEFQYPLELHWFSDGIYIMGTTKDYQELLGAKIITLNGKKIEEAVQTLRPLLAGANDSWFQTQIVYYMTIPDVLKYFGLSMSDEIELGVELNDGQMKNIKLMPISYKDYVAVHHQSNEPVPLYQSHPDEYYWYEYLKKQKIIYLNYNSCRERRDKPFEIFDKEFWYFVHSHDIEKLVLDIRENRGGISTILDPFIKELKNSALNQKDKLYVIIGKDTYSSAVLNAVSLKTETKAYFVGEATGGEPNHYGEVKRFKLPNSQITIRYSTKYFHQFDQDINTLEPDKVIKETFADNWKGTDPVIEWIEKQN